MEPTDRDTKVRYAICVSNEGYEIDLELLKVYSVLPASPEESDLDLVRVVDETGEDYLYPVGYFVPVELPEAAASRLLETRQKA